MRVAIAAEIRQSDFSYCLSFNLRFGMRQNHIFGEIDVTRHILWGQHPIG
jgi:hypothetical protein